MLCQWKDSRQLFVSSEKEVLKFWHEGTAQRLPSQLQRPSFQVPVWKWMCPNMFQFTGVCLLDRIHVFRGFYLHPTTFGCRSGFSLGGGVFPVCWKGLHSLLGCSTDLLNSCVQGAHAKTPPTTVRRGVPGINTYPTVSLIEAPLLNKGDTVER